MESEEVGSDLPVGRGLLPVPRGGGRCVGEGPVGSRRHEPPYRTDVRFRGGVGAGADDAGEEERAEESIPPRDRVLFRSDVASRTVERDGDEEETRCMMTAEVPFQIDRITEAIQRFHWDEFGLGAVAQAPTQDWTRALGLAIY